MTSIKASQRLEKHRRGQRLGMQIAGEAQVNYGLKWAPLSAASITKETHDAWRGRLGFAAPWLALAMGTMPFVGAFGLRAADLKLEARDKVVLQEKCARCHSVEAAGESPLKIAPPMREIYGRYPCVSCIQNCSRGR